MDYKIAIPSYKRHNIIKEKSLKLLKKNKINFEKINVFVANKEEKKLYSESLKNLIPENQIIVGVHKIGLQRNFIENYYKENTKLIMIDDDIDGVYIKDGEKKLKKIPNLEKIGRAHV